MRARFATTALLTGACSSLAPSLSSQEAELASVVERLRTERASSREAFRVLPCDRAYESGPHSCYSEQVRAGDLAIGVVHFRPQRGRGAIIQLEGVGPGCIRLEAMQSRFSGGSVRNSCDHGICRYYNVDGPSGRLSFGLPTSDQAPQCVTSVVLNFDG